MSNTSNTSNTRSSPPRDSCLASRQFERSCRRPCGCQLHCLRPACPVRRMSDEKTSDMTTTKPPQPPPQPQQQQQPQPQPAASATETASEEGVPPDAVGAVIWSWEDDSNSWEPFSPMLQSQLEAAHAGSKHAVPVDGQRCVDVGAMMQIHTNGRRRPVRRVVAATITMMPVTVATYNIAGGHGTYLLPRRRSERTTVLERGRHLPAGGSWGRYVAHAGAPLGGRPTDELCLRPSTSDAGVWQRDPQPASAHAQT